MATTHAQTTLTAGDIVVLGLNADDAYPNQRWAFMAMRDIAATTVIRFTDKGYDGTTGEFRLPNANPTLENDGYMTWTVPSLITKGTVIYANNNTVNGSSSGVSGQLGDAITGFGFNSSGDQIIVYQGTSGTASGATFIYALNTGQHAVYGTSGTWLTSGAITQDYHSWLPPGLTNGSTALALTSNMTNAPVGTGSLGSANYGFDNMYYGGTTSGSKATLLAAIGNPSNWLGNNTTAFNLSSSSGLLPSTFTVLPVTLLYFNVESQAGETVQLTWGTAMERNNDHFTIERSEDGVHYKLLATLPGKGDHDQPMNYSFIDHTPEPGLNYYRLSETDRDDREKILGVKSTSVREIALRVGPNPAMQFVEAAFNRGAWQEIKLYNSAEQLLQTIPLKVTASEVKIGLQDYRPGSYYLAFVGSNGRTNVVRKIVKR